MRRAPRRRTPGRRRASAAARLPGTPASWSSASWHAAISGVCSARLGQDRVAGGQRGGDLAGEDRQREVPRADADEHAAAVQRERLRSPAGPGSVSGAANWLSARRGVVAAEVGRLAHLGDARRAASCRPRAPAARSGGRAARLQRVGHGAQHRGARRAAGARPRRAARRAAAAMARRRSRPRSHRATVADHAGADRPGDVDRRLAVARQACRRRSGRPSSSSPSSAAHRGRERGARSRGSVKSTPASSCARRRRGAGGSGSRVRGAAPDAQGAIGSRHDLSTAASARRAGRGRRRCWRRSPAAGGPGRAAGPRGRRPARRRAPAAAAAVIGAALVERLAHAVQALELDRAWRRGASSRTAARVWALWVANCG